MQRANAMHTRPLPQPTSSMRPPACSLATTSGSGLSHWSVKRLSYRPRLMRSSAATQSGPKSSNGTPPPFSKACATPGAARSSGGTISNMPPAKWSDPSEARK
jgi:hypothetical protein